VWDGQADLHGSPQIVREVIAHRLHRLAPSCREVLAVASVLGQSFDHKVLLIAVSPVDESGLLRDVDRAIAAQVLQDRPGGYAFRHALVRDAVYWDLTMPRRMLLHARAGELLERLYGARAEDHAAELAYHFALAGESSELRAKALRYSLVAGRRAAGLSSYPEALTHFNRASDIIEADSSLASSDLRFDTLSGRGRAEANLARYPESVATLRQALELSTDPIQRGRARRTIAFALALSGTPAELVAECEAGMAEVANVGGPDATEIRATLHQLIAWIRFRQGRFAEVLQIGQAIEREAATAEPGPRMLAHKVTGWGLQGLGRVEEAIQQFELSVAEAERWGEKVSLARAFENLGYQEFLGGRFAAAREHLARALSQYRESASEQMAVLTLLFLCRVWVAEGEHTRASQQIARAFELETDGGESFEGEAHFILGQIHSIGARWQDATISFEKARAIATRTDDRLTAISAIVALGFVDQCVGRWHDAAARYSEALRLSRDIDPSPHRLLALRHLGRLRLSARELDAAAVDLGEALGLAQTMPETLEYAPTLLAVAELRLELGHADEALDLAQQALGQARPVEQVIEALIMLARIQLARGEPVLAHTYAAQALVQAARWESPRLLALAHLAVAQTMTERDTSPAGAGLTSALHYAEDAQTPLERALVLRAYAAFLRQTGSSQDLAEAADDEASGISRTLRLTVLRGTTAIADEERAPLWAGC
jgi:tetratricopeptide (TPR) repeat protein